MSMRLEIAFARPLDRPTRLRFLVVAAAQAKTTRVGWRKGHQAAVITGEALDPAAFRALLADEGIAVESLRSSLADPAPAEDAGLRERLRPPGR
jgi:hypothetical protein